MNYKETVNNKNATSGNRRKLTSIAISVELHNKLKKIAQEEERNIQIVVNRILKKALGA